MPTVDLSILANKASLTGSEQIILNDGGSAKDVTVSLLASHVLSNATSLTVTGSTAYPIDVSMASGADRGVRLSMSADGNATFLNFQRSKGTPIAPTAVASGQQMGRISYSGHDGSVYLPSVEIRAEVDGAVSGGSVPGRLLVSTRAAGAAGYSERVRVTSDGDVGIGTTSPTSRFHVTRGANSNGAIKVSCTGITSGSFASMNFETGNTAFSTGMEGNGRFFVYNAAAAADQLALSGGANSGVDIKATGTGAIVLNAGAAERVRVESNGNLTSGVAGSRALVACPSLTASESWNSSNTSLFVGSNTVTGRSVSASGTVNASGADYAEYESNNGLAIQKGAVVGFKADGTLTLTFSEAVRFGIKSTNPSYVGGDTWGSEEAIGLVRPSEPERNMGIIQTFGEGDEAYDEVIEVGDTDEEWAAKLLQHQNDLNAFEAALEAARQAVDRVAYSGKVPVNVTGAAPGGYIVAIDDGGQIAGGFVADPTFTQYKRAVGRVNRILPDGRAEVAVIVH